jgi:peptidyl-prolyl cis-trans isomerase D
MLQKLRDQTQGTGFRVITVLLIFALVVGLGAANFFASTNSDVAEVGGQGISEFDLSRQTERERRRILSQLGEDFNPNDLDRNQIQQFALSRLINEEVSRQTLVDLGLGFSNRAIDKEIINSSAYRGAEGFDNDLYLAQITALGYTNESFKEAVGVDLGAGLLRQAIENSVYVSEKEVDDAYRFIQQKRDLAYIKLSYQEYSEKVVVDEEDIETRYEEEKDRFLSEEMLDLEYVLLNEESAKRKFELSAELTEVQLLDAYEAESELKLSSAERSSSHILLTRNQAANEESLRAKASELRERVLGGESFEEIARSFSEDEVSAAEGGFLGFAGRGVFEPEFESVLWALESEGDISEVFETKFGLHIIRLDEIASVDIASFEDRKDALQEDLIGELAREKLEIMAEELERFVFEESISLVNLDWRYRVLMTCQQITLQKSLVVILLLIQGLSAKCCLAVKRMMEKTLL